MSRPGRLSSQQERQRADDIRAGQSQLCAQLFHGMEGIKEGEVAFCRSRRAGRVSLPFTGPGPREEEGEKGEGQGIGAQDLTLANYNFKHYSSLWPLPW